MTRNTLMDVCRNPHLANQAAILSEHEIFQSFCSDNTASFYLSNIFNHIFFKFEDAVFHKYATILLK